MTRLTRLVLLALALVLVAGLPAAAGSRDDPEITDRCGDLGESDDLRVTPEWVDVCAGWFETLSAGSGDTPEIRVTLQLAGDVADRTSAFYWLWWNAGDCVYEVARDDAPDGPLSEPLVWFDAWCDGFDEPTARVFLDDAWAEDGDTVSWTVRFDGDLAAFAGHHDQGSQLTSPRAMTGLRVGPVYGWTVGCTFGDPPWPNGCFEALGNWTPSGETYTVGS